MQSPEQAELKFRFKEYAALLEKGLAVKALDEFYDEQIIQYENNDVPVSGKHQLRSKEIENLSLVNSFNTEFSNVLIDTYNGWVWGEMIIRFDSKKSGKKKLREAFFQKWCNGKIKEQKFYYKEIEDDK